MRRYQLLLILILFSFALSSFAVNFENAIENFESLVIDYDKGDSEYQKEFDFMSVYRKYTLSIIGGVKNDSHYYDLNILLEKLFNKYKTGDSSEDISLAAFFAYVSSDLFDNTFDITVLNSFPPYYKSFDGYVQEIKNYSTAYFSQWIGYSIGLVSQKPDELFDVQKSSSRLRVRVKLDYEMQPELFSIIEENINDEIKERLQTAIVNVKSDLRRNDDERALERSIKKNSVYVFSPVIDEINKDKEIISNGFIEHSPKEFNLWMLRFVIYAILILIFIRNKKILPFILATVIIFDSIYLFTTGSLIVSDVESLLYGILSIMFFAFAIIMYIINLLKKEKNGTNILINTILILLVLLLYTIPMFTSPDTLMMDNIDGFYVSPSYEALKDDLFIWEKSYFRETIVEFDNSNITAEKADELLEKKYLKTIGYAGKDLKEELDVFIKETLANEKYASFSRLKSALNTEGIKTTAPSIKIYNTWSGSVVIMYLTLLSAVIIISRGSFGLYIVNFSLMIFHLCWFTFKTSYTFMVEKGFPLIYNQKASPNYFLLIAVFVLLFVALYMVIKSHKDGKISS